MLRAAAESEPAKLLHFFELRLAREEAAGEDDEGYEAIPWDFHQLGDLLAPHAAEVVMGRAPKFDEGFLVFCTDGHLRLIGHECGHDHFDEDSRRLGPQALDALMMHVARVDLEPEAVRISFIRKKTPRHAIADAEIDLHESALAVVIVPIRARLRGGRTWISGPPGSDGTVRARRDPVLIRGLQQAHRILARHGWRLDGAIKDGRSFVAPANPYERKLCRLALLAPDIQNRILQGRQPRGLTLEQLVNSSIPTAWPAQREAFGFTELG